jgi:hypothetical protein
MADTKISALPAATTPLAGTEVLPIVQGGVTEKVAVDDLTVKNVRSNATSGILQVTGPAAAATRVMTTPDANFTVARTDAAQSFTGDQTLSTGNLIIGTSGKGIDFSATPGTGTSELLSDYEEGTFTATLTSATPPTTPPTVTSRYTKIGQQVTVTIRFNNVNTTGAAGRMRVTGLPFTSGSILTVGPTVGSDLITVPCVAYTLSSTEIYFVNAANEADIAIVAGTGRYLAVTLTYFV